VAFAIGRVSEHGDGLESVKKTDQVVGWQGRHPDRLALTRKGVFGRTRASPK
jgi:hypothetical protein